MSLSSVKQGKAAEHIVIAKLLLQGYNVYTSVTEDNKIDVLFGDKLQRVQVKVFSKYKRFAVRKVGVNSKTNTKISYYTADDIDLFAAVDLDTFDVFLVPIEFAASYTAEISKSTLIKNGFMRL